MYRIHIVLCVLVVKTLQVSCQCGTDINNIPEAKAVNEILTGILWNISVNAQANWTFEATQINAIDITSQDKKNVEEYFSVQKLTSSSSDTYLVFNITKPLDKESPFWINVSKGELNMIHFKIECISPPSPSIPKTIFLTISPVNEFAQKFNVSVPKTIQVTENAAIGKIVFNIFPYITDEDIPRSGMTDYSYTIQTNQDEKQNDGSDWFYIPITSSDSIVIRKSLDFETLKKENRSIMSLLIIVKANDESNFQVNATLQIEILDADDFPPSFVYTRCDNNCGSYEAYTDMTYRGYIIPNPNNIRAKDQDTFDSQIRYSIMSSANKYHSSFLIDPITANITQIGDVLKTDILIIVATEDTTNGHFQTTNLLIHLRKNSDCSTTAWAEIIAIVVGVTSALIIGILVFSLYLVRRKTEALYANATNSGGDHTYDYVKCDRETSIDGISLHRPSNIVTSNISTATI